MNTNIKEWFSRLWLWVIDPTAAITDLDRRKEQNRVFNQMQAMLLNDSKKLAEAQKKFEKAFGINSYYRTPAQWKRLLNVYGIKTICEKEKMSEDEVLEKIKSRGR